MAPRLETLIVIARQQQGCWGLDLRAARGHPRLANLVFSAPDDGDDVPGSVPPGSRRRVGGGGGDDEGSFPAAATCAFAGAELLPALRSVALRGDAFFGGGYVSGVEAACTLYQVAVALPPSVTDLELDLPRRQLPAAHALPLLGAALGGKLERLALGRCELPGDGAEAARAWRGLGLFERLQSLDMEAASWRPAILDSFEGLAAALARGDHGGREEAASAGHAAEGAAALRLRAVTVGLPCGAAGAEAAARLRGLEAQCGGALRFRPCCGR
jgi:hypothetical protein